MNQTGHGRARADDPRLEAARALARWLDAAFVIPGTRVRVGLDPLIGLIPGIGDAIGAAMGGYLILIASRLGVPPSVLTRMALNVGVETVIGAVPLVGDLFDFAWRANLRNVQLLETYLETPGATRRRSRLLVAVLLIVCGLVLAGAIAGAVLIVQAIVQALG